MITYKFLANLQMLVGKPPFLAKSQPELYSVVKSVGRVVLPPHIRVHPGCQDLLDSLLQVWLCKNVLFKMQSLVQTQEFLGKAFSRTRGLEELCCSIPPLFSRHQEFSFHFTIVLLT